MANTLDYAFFYNSENGDRKYDAESFEHWLKKFFTSGVFTGELKVTANNDMTVTLGKGYANVDGKVKLFASDNALKLETANATYDRIDSIVIERNDSKRDVVAKVVTGGYASNPIAHVPVRSGGIYQLVVAQIRVNHGAVMITQTDITDTRAKKDLCGLVTGTVNEIDFDEICNRYDAWLDEQKTAITTWFDNVKGQLSEDVAVNLQNQVDNLRTKSNEIETKLFETDAKVPSLEWLRGGYKKGSGSANAITFGENVHEVHLLVQIAGSYYVPITFPVVDLANDAFIYMTNSWGATGYVYYAARRNSADGSVTVYLVGADNNGKAVADPSWGGYYR